MNCRNNSHPWGFTLIEMLVVIGIIAVLAGLMFPVFITVRERARQTTCLSNVKQIGTGMLLWTQDHGERFPGEEWIDAQWLGGRQGSLVKFRIRSRNNPNLTFDVGGNPPPEQRFLYTYVKNEEIFRCPSGRIWGIGTIPPDAECPSLRDWDTEGTSYVWNSRYWMGDSVGYAPIVGRSLASIRYPSAQIMVAERGLHEFSYCMPGDRPVGYRSHDSDKPLVTACFVDGHARAVVMEYGLWQGYPDLSKIGSAEWIIAMPETRR